MADAAPPGPPPPGMDDDKSWVAIFTVVLCLTFATLVVGLRLYTRKFITKRMGMDDWAAIVTLFVLYAEGITIATATRHGLGRHIYALEDAEVTEYFKCFWLSIVLYCTGLLTAKMTFLLQYYRVLAVQRMRIIYIVAIVIVGCWGLSQVLIGIFMCWPIRGFWDKTVEATCIPQSPQFQINAAGNIITDVAVFLLPMPVIKHLKLPRTQRVLLFGVFSLGFFTVAISVIRIKFLKQEDPTWDNIESSGWSMGELTSALTCACLPTLRPFFSRFFPSLAGSSAQPSTGYDKYKNADSELSGRSRRLFKPRGAMGTDLLLETKDGAESRSFEEWGGETGKSPFDDLRRLGLGTTTRTVIRGPGQGLGIDGERYEAPGDGPGAIQVQRDVYQTNSWRP